MKTPEVSEVPRYAVVCDIVVEPGGIDLLSQIVVFKTGHMIEGFGIRKVSLLLKSGLGRNDVDVKVCILGRGMMRWTLVHW